MSMVTDEESFYDVSRRVLGILLLAGAMPQLSYPSIVVNPEIEADSIEHEGVPFPMASIQGLPRSQLRGLVDAFNSKQPSRKKWVYLSLINTSQKSIVSGEVTMVVAFVRTLRCISAAPGEDQSRVPFTRRKPRILVNYISMTAPYHCELLRDATTKQHMYAVEKGWILDAADMRVPVRAGDDAHDIRAEENLTKYLFESICVLPVNWPVAITNTGSTHIVDFGPGGETGFASLTFRNVKGRGIAVICASSLTARLESPLGTKADLFRENIGHVVGAADWERDFSPRLVRTMHDNKVHIDTRMSRVLGCPTNMVPGMTPATAGAEFVAAVANAGYHVELAGGGMHSEQEMRERISRLTGLSPPGTGITLNCIYINQRQWLFQFPLLLRMRREGYPISGLCIGGGVPSLDQANQVIHGLRDAGIRHVAFKPGNLQTIRAVISIARANPDFPVILQWTGGRAGGHHSYEDFHQPILNSYSTIRAQRNIVLVGGSGFGGHQDSVPYLTGEWSLQYDDVRMPFDGILFGSRVMTAREGSAADACKQLMAAATGVDDDEWANTYTGVAGGVTSVISEFGEHIHVLDTRCTRLWKELDATVFSQPRTKRLALLQAQKPDIIQKLNADYLRPWFGKKSDGSVADLEDMTYMEVIERLAELMYIKHHSRWVHPHWRSLFAEFAHRTIQRLGTDRDTELPSLLQLSDPAKAASELKLVCPQAANHLLASEDIQCFVSMCRQRGRKPVPFIPVLDDDFEVWFKKDALWQAEDIDAVIGQDVQRTFILYGPVAARFPVVANEPIKDLLDGIYQGQIAALLNQYYDGDESRIPVVPYLGSIAHAQPLPTSVSVATVDTDVVYRLPANVAALPDTSAWLAALSGSQKSWLNAIFSTAVIVQGTKYVDNYVRRVMRPRPCQIITVSYCNNVPVRVEIINSHGDRELMLSIDDSRVISLLVFASNGFEQSELCLRFRHHPSIAMAPIHEILDERDELIRKFYVQMWSAAGDSSLSDLTFAQKGLTVTQEHVSEFCRVIDNHSQHYKEDHGCQLIAPMDFLFVLAWPSILRSLTSDNIHCGLLNIVHLSNSFNFVDGSDQIAVSDTVDADAKAIEVVNTAIGKRVTVEASIYRNSARIATINSVFLYRGVEIDFGLTFTRRDNNVVQVRFDTMDDIAVLESKEWISWLESDGRCSLCPGDTLEFCTDSLYQYMTQDIFSSVSVSGK
ncbi:fatty acid synthase alpha subunit Lsd1, partial [Linderina pennispora]